MKESAMKKRSFFWHVFPLFLVVSVLSCLLLVLYNIHEIKKFYLEQTRAELVKKAMLIQNAIELALDKPAREMDSLVDDLGAKTDVRFTVVLAGGKVTGDTREDPAIMDNHVNRPEIIKALAGDTGFSVRYSSTLSRDLMYVAIPIRSEGRVSAAIRASVPLISIKDAPAKLYKRLFSASVYIIAIAILLSVWLSRRLSRPLVYLRELSNKIALGEFSRTIHVDTGIDEINGLAASMDTMTRLLGERIAIITKQKNEQDAILSSMVEGVIALDMSERIIMINQAAGKMFDVDTAAIKGKWIQEAVRNSGLHKCIHDLFARKASVTAEVGTASERMLDVHGSIIRGVAQHDLLGVCIVLHDVTDLKKLEQMRRDFVANVSHELRTPLTLIKGFVETLLDGAMKNPADLERFLTIINNHVNRLNTLIEDLLTISHLEKAEQQENVDRATAPLDEVVDRAIEFCMPRAAQKNIGIVKTGIPGIVAPLHASLFEQALINLIDNSIKYSTENTTITIATHTQNGTVSVSVADQGCGIAPEHISRIFERFYRVDKARSRKLGGTGLGLSIVKHIVQVHRGTIKVESETGQGSVFTVTLPKTDANDDTQTV